MELALPSLPACVQHLILHFQLNLTLDPRSLLLQICVVALVLALLYYISRLRQVVEEERRSHRQQRWASLVRAALDAHAFDSRTQPIRRHQAFRHPGPTAPPAEEDPCERTEPPRSTLRPTAKARMTSRLPIPCSRAAYAAMAAEVPSLSPPDAAQCSLDARMDCLPPAPRVSPPVAAKPPAPQVPKKIARPPTGGSLPVPCPLCNSQLSLKKARHGGWFWGCQRWPECRGSRKQKEGEAIRVGSLPASSPQ